MTVSACVKKLEIADIIRDHDTLQVRAEVDPKTVEQYARSMKAGAKFPPVQVYEVDGRLFLVDGFHRVAAAETVAHAKQSVKHWYPRSRGRVLRYIGEDMEAAVELLVQHHLHDVR